MFFIFIRINQTNGKGLEVRKMGVLVVDGHKRDGGECLPKL